MFQHEYIKLLPCEVKKRGGRKKRRGKRCGVARQVRNATKADESSPELTGFGLPYLVRASVKYNLAR